MRKKSTHRRALSASPNSTMTRPAGAEERGSEYPHSEAHSDVDSRADGEGSQAAQGCSSQGSEDFVADQDGHPCCFGVSVSLVFT